MRRAVSQRQFAFGGASPRESGVTVARLTERACFGESGVLSSMGRSIPRVEMHNSVATSACHMLVLETEHYEQLSSFTVQHLDGQVSCRTNWEEMRGKAMLEKRGKKKGHARPLTSGVRHRGKSGRLSTLPNVARTPMPQQNSDCRANYVVYNMRPATTGSTRRLDKDYRLEGVWHALKE